MDPTPQNVNERPHLNELGDVLRPAVEQVRMQALPQEALSRSLGRARALGPVAIKFWRRPGVRSLASVAAAALIVVGLCLWAQDYIAKIKQPEPQYVTAQAASHRVPMSDGSIRTEWPPGMKPPGVKGEKHPDEPAVGFPVAANPGAIPEMRVVIGGVPGKGHNTEAYDHYTDNPFLAADRDPLSTFSLDVHTASYSNVRRFLLQEKRLPPPDAVRVAELINYFPYAYPAPKGEHPVTFTVNLAECPWNRKHHLVRIGMRGKLLDPTKMPPRNLVFLVDTSGSMDAPNRLPLLKSSLVLLVEQLTPRDRVAIVAYAGSAGLVLPSTPGSDKKTILAALDRLAAGGSTNGGQGITLAYKVAREHFQKDGLNRVVLGTDGDFNVGVTSQGDLVRLIEEQRKDGVWLTVLGYGMGNLKDSMMEKLAHHGGGHYAYIDSMAEARKVFVEQGAALMTIARDVKLQVEFNPARVGAYRLIGYENRLLRAEDFNDDRKHAGDIGAGHTVTALYEIVPAGQPLPVPAVDKLKYQKPPKPSKKATDEWLTVKMRYKDPGTDRSKLLTQPLAGAAVKMERAPADFRFAAAVASFGMLLRNSEHRGKATYADVRTLSRTCLEIDPHGHRKAFLQLVDAAEELARKQEAGKPAAP